MKQRGILFEIYVDHSNERDWTYSLIYRGHMLEGDEMLAHTSSTSGGVGKRSIIKQNLRCYECVSTGNIESVHPEYGHAFELRLNVWPRHHHPRVCYTYERFCAIGCSIFEYEVPQLGPPPVERRLGNILVLISAKRRVCTSSMRKRLTRTVDQWCQHVQDPCRFKHNQ